MNPQLKKLSDQVIVITGASSGIGLATARMAACAGARLVLAARNDAALAQLVEEIRREGGQAVHVETEVGSEADLRRVADEAISTFGASPSAGAIFSRTRAPAGDLLTTSRFLPLFAPSGPRGRIGSRGGWRSGRGWGGQPAGRRRNALACLHCAIRGSATSPRHRPLPLQTDVAARAAYNGAHSPIL
jgi:NADPH:quinone reductase-like Zn-dependent oxidoreductase